MSESENGDSHDRAAAASAVRGTSESRVATPAVAVLADLVAGNSSAVDFILGGNRAVTGMFKSPVFESFAADSAKAAASIADNTAFKTLAVTAAESVAAVLRSPAVTSVMADVNQPMRNLATSPGLAALVPRNQSVVNGLFENPGLKALIAGQSATVSRLLGEVAQAFPANLLSTMPMSNLTQALTGFAGVQSAEVFVVGAGPFVEV